MSNASGKAAKRLRELLASDVVIAGAVYDGITAVTTQAAGFPAGCISGGYASMALGMPNRGLITLTEMVGVIKAVTRNVEIPIVADGDTGYGGIASVQRAVREFEAAGAAAIIIEDQDDDPKCGYALQQIGVLPAEEFVGKVRAACDARESDDFVVVARSDALRVNGWDDLKSRAKMYLDAGADLFQADGITPKEMHRYGEEFPKRGIPTLYHGSAAGNPVQGVGLSLAELREYGFKMQVMSSGMLTIFPALYRVLVSHISGRTVPDDELPGMYDLFRLSGDADVDAAMKKFAVSVG